MNYNDGYSCDSCISDCETIYDFLKLTNELMNTIMDLEDEVIRWRQVLIKYLPDDWAEGLRQDIMCNLSRDFEGDPAYDLYVKWFCDNVDPQHDQAGIDRKYRLANGTDETSIDYI